MPGLPAAQAAPAGLQHQRALTLLAYVWTDEFNYKGHPTSSNEIYITLIHTERSTGLNHWDWTIAALLAFWNILAVRLCIWHQLECCLRAKFGAVYSGMKFSDNRNDCVELSTATWHETNVLGKARDTVVTPHSAPHLLSCKAAGLFLIQALNGQLKVPLDLLRLPPPLLPHLPQLPQTVAPHFPATLWTQPDPHYPSWLSFEAPAPERLRPLEPWAWVASPSWAWRASPWSSAKPSRPQGCCDPNRPAGRLSHCRHPDSAGRSLRSWNSHLARPPVSGTAHPHRPFLCFGWPSSRLPASTAKRMYLRLPSAGRESWSEAVSAHSWPCPSAPGSCGQSPRRNDAMCRIPSTVSARQCGPRVRLKVTTQLVRTRKYVQIRWGSIKTIGNIHPNRFAKIEDHAIHTLMHIYIYIHIKGGKNTRKLHQGAPGPRHYLQSQGRSKSLFQVLTLGNPCKAQGPWLVSIGHHEGQRRFQVQLEALCHASTTGSRLQHFKTPTLSPKFRHRLRAFSSSTGGKR